MSTITDRIDATTRIPPRFLRADPPAPRSVKIEISSRCNYRCGFCALRTREKQPKWDMDFGLFKRITREMRDAGVEEIGVFYLGESFMNPRLLVDCIAYLKNEIAMPYVFLTSNASMASPEAVGQCMKAGLDSLKWSVNAADESQFERIMGVSGKLFGRALNNIHAAWLARLHGGYRTGLYASSILYDREQQQKMERLLRRRGPALLAAALLHGRVRRAARAGAWLPPHGGEPGADRRPARAAPVLGGLHGGPRHHRGDALRLLLRRDGALDHEQSQ